MLLTETALSAVSVKPKITNNGKLHFALIDMTVILAIHSVSSKYK